MYAIETNNLSKHYGSLKAVDKLNLKVPKGAVCGFLGKNGAGKTTAIKMMVGLAKPTDGEIFLMGEKRKFGYHNNSKIGYLPDVPSFYGYMTAYEYLCFCGELYKMENKKLKVYIPELLKRVGLNNTKTRISGYSRGMKQRLGIAQALINEPEIFFMDEPVSALDPVGRKDVIEIIKGLSKDVTVFFSTHILTDVESICDYILILDKGEILLQNTLENIRRTYIPNAVRLRFYGEADGEYVMEAVSKIEEMVVDRINAVEYLMKSGNIRESGKNVLKFITNEGIELENYQSYTPTLEDIFLKAIDRGNTHA